MPKQNVGRSMSLTSQESYSAVIIADMVAEVQNQSEGLPNVLHRNNSTRSEVINRKGSLKRPKKDQINLGYDGHQTDSSPAAIVDVDSMETVSPGTTKNNGTDITKGVILNAQLDHKLGSEFFNGGGKAIELSSTVQVSSDVGGKDSKEGKEVLSSNFQDMSILRKIAFAVSFMPSIMFVLCFAIILPCEKKLPCVQEMWTATFNNTEVTSGLKFPERIVFAFARDGSNGLQGLDQNTGIFAWNETLPSPTRFMDCANLMTNDSQACLVSDSVGAVHFYNAANGEQLLRWDPTDGIEGVPIPSVPAILPDCDGDGVAEVAVAVTPTKVKVLSKGFSVFTVNMPDYCDQLPVRLTPWTRENGTTDLVFVCQKGTNEHLMRISQDKWCLSVKTNRGKGEVVTLDTRKSGELTKSLLLATGNGLVVWSESEVTMIEPNGLKKWTVPSEDHSNINRFLLFGKFNKTDSQVALFSSDILTSLQMTTLSSETGERVWNRSIANAEISDVSLIQGAEKDFALVVMRKMERDLTNQAVSHIVEVSTSIINLLTKEEMDAKTPNVTSSTVVEEISFLDLNGNFSHTIEEKKMSFSEGETFSSSVTVVPKEKEAKDLTIIALRKSSKMASAKTSHLKRINVANWDISLPQTRQCIWGN